MKKQLKLILMLVLTLFSSVSYCQNVTFFRDTTIHVSKNNVLLENAWAGGINGGIFAEMELNGDGKMDLLVYSSQTNRISPFMNNGLINKPSYTYAPEFISRFPSNLEGWIRTYDYDGDGDLDLFSYNNAAIRVDRNDFNVSSGLSFTNVSIQIYTHYGTFPTNIYVSRVNMPALADLDNDGDMDILAFSIGGSWVEHHKNYSMDSTGNPNSFLFYNIPQCWGYFALKNNYNSAELPPIPANCPLLPANPTMRVSSSNNYANFLDPNKARHAGSTLLALDMNGDGDQDVLNGDILSPNLLYIENCGNSDSAWMCNQDSMFPSYDIPANMQDIAAPYYMDVDNDGNKDLIVSNFFESGEDFFNVKLYKNTTNNATNVFSFVKNRFMVDQMIDVGTGAHPEFFDVDNDGKKDLLVANDYYYNTNQLIGRITYYRNISTTSKSEYQFVTDDYANLSTTGLIGLNLAFGDLDGDTDNDMIVGESDGNLMYFENTAQIGTPATFVLTQINYQSINVGDNSSPQLIDLDRDGLLDLVIGERSGKLNYYRNTGSSSNAVFSFITDSLGGVDVNKQFSFAGFSIPRIFENGNGYELLVGSTSGYIYHYTNIDGNLNGLFTLADSMYNNIFEPGRSSPCIHDVDGDGKFDLLIGNQGGGVVLYTQNAINTVWEKDKVNAYFDLYPNPTSDWLNLRINSKDNIFKNKIQIRDVTGKTLFETEFSSSNYSVDLKNFLNGTYLCTLIVNNKQYSRVFIKN